MKGQPALVVQKDHLPSSIAATAFDFASELTDILPIVLLVSVYEMCLSAGSKY